MLPQSHNEWQSAATGLSLACTLTLALQIALCDLPRKESRSERPEPGNESNAKRGKQVHGSFRLGSASMQPWCETSSSCSPDPRSGAATITLDWPLSAQARHEPRCWVRKIAGLSDLSTCHARALRIPGAGTGEAFAVGLDLSAVDLVCARPSVDTALVDLMFRGKGVWTAWCISAGEWRRTLAKCNGMWGRARCCDETDLQLSPC